jgi:hypothetical protein
MKSKNLIALVLIVVSSFSSTRAQTRETWRSVRTNHLFIIGNADPEKLRQVASWLEFFHSTFAKLVSRNVLDSSVSTTVVIFKDDASFMPFKPLYQGRPANIAGYFQAGSDMNYIVLSLDPRYRDPYSTAFHEYVHLHVRDNIPGAPLWLNEGLAELYGNVQFSDNDALIGAPLYGYLNLLRENELLPLNTLFSISTSSPHYNERDKSGIFYGESWALVHYLMLGQHGRQDQFKRFLQQVGSGETAAKAIEKSFGTSVPMLEEDFRTYVRQGSFNAQHLGSSDAQSYTAYTAIQRSTLTEDETKHYLGTLLLRQGRYAEAKNYLPNLAQTQDPLDRASKTAPVQTATAGMLGGEPGGVVVHDGHAIENSGSLPAIDEVLNKYEDAMGGAAALNAVTTRVIKGTVDVVGISRGGTFETYMVGPNKTLSVVQAQPLGTVKVGYNGRVGWMQTAAGVRTLKDVELRSVQSDAEFYDGLRLKNSYAKVSLLGKSKIGYRDVYVVELQPATGTADRLYLDAESYVPVRLNTVRVQGGVVLPVEIYFDDWREVDGVKAPYSVTQSFPKRTVVLTVREIRSNVTLESKLFERPS